MLFIFDAHVTTLTAASSLGKIIILISHLTWLGVKWKLATYIRLHTTRLENNEKFAK